ncbi:UNVERIFIED_CONTAM: hypothetical protein GTU68_007157, partial [Idotea baltica]|nr:hypothetical protein [Idotea baltica]
EFPSKPGRVDRAPPFIVPHQPRVDWQLWFAALGSYTQNPWFVSMAHKFLAGEKEVLNFLDRSSPWRQKPPKYIRALKYFYHYTSLNDTSGNWWRRELEGEYMPTYSVNHGPLLDYLRSQQLLDTKDVRVKNQILAHFLDAVREMSNVLENHLTIYSLFIAAFLILFTKSRLF